MRPDHDALAQDLTARYALGPLLGKGGFGSVHRARDVAAGRDVAIKLLTNVASGGAVDRFLREAAVAATLEHPGLVKVHAFGRHGGRLAIVYELVDGDTFSGATRTMSPRARAEMVRDAARGVAHAHARGIVHRDLKPDNLLVGTDGRVRVADFGLVWHEGAEHLTRTGAIIGTPAYMAPELFDSDERVRASTAADVWALGVILYEALTGCPPFNAGDLVALMGQVQHAHIRPPRSIDPGIDRALEAVCMRALDRSPARRFADAGALAQALDDALAGRAPAAAGRRRGAAAALGALALCAVAAGAWLSSRAPSREPPPTTASEGTPPTTATEAAAPPPAPMVDRTLLRASGERWAAWVDARRVVTGGPDDDVRLWDAATGEALRSWPRATTAGRRVEPGRVALVSDAGLHVLAVDGDDHPRSLGRLVSAEQLDVAEEAGVVAVLGRSSDGDQGVFLVSPDGRRRPVPLPADQGDVVSLAVAADGSRLAVSRSHSSEEVRPTSVLAPGGPLVTFEVGDRVTLRDQLMVPSVGEALRFAVGGPDLVVGTTRGQLGWVPRDAHDFMSAFEAKTAEPPHAGPVRALAFTRDGARMLSASDHPDGHELITWDVTTRGPLGGTTTGPGQAVSLDVSPDGRAAVVGTRGGGVHVRTLETATPAEPAAPPLTDRQLVQASSPRFAVWVDARRVLTGGEGDDVRLWDAAAGVELRAWPLGARTAIVTAPGRVALGAATGVVLLDVDAGTAPRELGRFSDVQQVACAELTGQLAVIGQTSGVAGHSVHLVSPSGEQRSVPLPSDRRRPLAVAVSRDGKRLAVSLGEAGADDASSEFESMMIGVAGTILLYTNDGAIRSRHSAVVPGRATMMRFNADGSELLVGSNLGQFGLIPFELGEVMGEFIGSTSPGRAHPGVVRDLRLVPGVDRVLSLGDADAPDAAELKVWRYPHPAELRTLTAPGRPLSLDVSPDGRAVAIGTHAHGVHVRVIAP